MKKIITSIFLAFSLFAIFNIPVKAAPKLTKSSVVISKGKTYKLKVTGSKKKIKWSSRNKNIATVSKKGTVKGKHNGKTYIYAKVGKKILKCKVVIESPVLSITNNAMTVGEQYTVKLYNCSRKKTFISSNPTIASVSSKGVIIAKREGYAKISIKISDNIYYCYITVKSKKQEEIKHIPSGKRNDPKNAYDIFTSDLYDNAKYLGNFSIKLLNFQKGQSIEGVTPIKKIDEAKYPDTYEYLYLKFQVKYNYGKDVVKADRFLKNKNINDPNISNIYDFFDISLNNRMKEWAPYIPYYDSCSNILDTNLLPGDSKIFSILMIIPKNQSLLGYRLQTGVNIGTPGDGFYTFTYFTTK